MAKLLMAALAAFAILMLTLVSAVPAGSPPEAPKITSWRALNLAHGSLAAEVADLKLQVSLLEARIRALENPKPKVLPLTER